jgi:putative ABC transport system permease protein
MVADLDDEYAAMPEGFRRDLWYRWEALRLGWHYRLMGSGVQAGDDRHHMTMGRGEGTMRSLWRNLGHGVRRLRRDPALAAVGMGTIALGVGATVAIFTVVNAVLLEPLPYERPQELVALFEADLDRGVDRNVANAGNARAWEDQAPSLREVGGAVVAQSAVVESPGEPQEVMASSVTPNYFRLLGMEMALGSPMSDDAGGRAATEVILSHRFWNSAFGADPGVVGRTLSVNGSPHEIVGVLSPGYVAFGEESAFFRSVPLTRMGDQTNSGRYLWVVGRMTPGAEVARLQQELDVVGRNLQEAWPDLNAGWTVRAVPLQEDVVGDSATGLWVLLASVGILLLIACANVANLLLSRATERRQEMAVRTSMGASGRDLFRQLVAESLVLAGAGGVLGVALAHAGTTLLAEAMPGAFALPRVAEAGVDARVLVFAVSVTLLTGLLFGLVPALEARRTAPARVLNAEGRGPSRATGRLRGALVVAEVALSLTLLVGAGLLARSFTTLLSVENGIRPEPVLTARVNLSGGRYADGEARSRFFQELVDRIAQEPGVDAVGANTFLPMVGLGAATSFRDFDAPVPPREEWPTADIRNVEGDYFGAMGIDLVAGRTLRATDGSDAPQVVVVNQSLASRLWPGADPVGRRLAISWGPLEEPWEVVGVVEDVRIKGPDTEPRPSIYHSYRQAAYFPFMQLAIRASGDPAALAPTLRGIVGEMDAGIPLSQPRLMASVVRDAVARPRLTTFLLGLFATVSALLAVVGLYGVLSYAVARRVREIGLRMAIGADGGRVLSMVVRQGMTLVLVGLAVGVVLAVLTGRVLSSLLFGVQSVDPVTFLGATAILGAASLAACVLPGWRATRVTPAEALRDG